MRDGVSVHVWGVHGGKCGAGQQVPWGCGVRCGAGLAWAGGVAVPGDPPVRFGAGGHAVQDPVPCSRFSQVLLFYSNDSICLSEREAGGAQPLTFGAHRALPGALGR